MICCKNPLALIVLACGLFGCCYGGLHSNFEAARLYENCIAGKMSGSMLFNETETTQIRRIVLEAGTRMFQLNLDPRTPSNARIMLRLFVASLSNMVAQDESSKRIEKKKAVLSALDTCASVLSHSLVSELADEVMQILSFVENEKLLTLAPNIAEDKPNSSKLLKEYDFVLNTPEKGKLLTSASNIAKDKPNSSKAVKEYDFGPNILDLNKRFKRDLVYFSSVPMYQNAAPRSRQVPSSPGESSIADSLLKSPSFVKTFNVGLSQQNAAYYSQGMVQSGLAGYPNSIVREAMNSVVTNVRSLGFVITPTDYARAIARTITSALRGKKVLSSASGANIGRNMVSKLENLVQNSSSPRRQSPVSQNAIKRMEAAQASAFSSASNIRSQVQSSNAQRSKKIASRVISESATRNGQVFEQQTFGDYNGGVPQSQFSDTSLAKSDSQPSAPNRASGPQSSNPSYFYESAIFDSPSNNKKPSSKEPVTKEGSSYPSNNPYDSGMGSEYESYPFDDKSMKNSENSLRNPSYSYEDTSSSRNPSYSHEDTPVKNIPSNSGNPIYSYEDTPLSNKQANSRNPSYSYEDTPLSNIPTNSRNPSYSYDDKSFSDQYTNSRNPPMPKKKNGLPNTPFGDKDPQYGDYQQSDSSDLNEYQAEKDTPINQSKNSRNPSKSSSPSEYNSYSYDFSDASNGQGEDDWASYYSMLSDQGSYPVGDYGLDSPPTDRSKDSEGDKTNEQKTPETEESSTSSGPGTEADNVSDTDSDESTSAETGARAEESVADASRPDDSAAAVTDEGNGTEESSVAASDSGSTSGPTTGVETENEEPTTDTEASATTVSDGGAATEGPVVTTTDSTADVGNETEESARATTDSGKSSTPEAGPEEGKEKSSGPVGDSGDVQEPTTAAPNTDAPETFSSENSRPDSTPTVAPAPVSTETPAASTESPQTGEQPSEEKPAKSEKNESAPNDEKPEESEKNESAPGKEKPAESEKNESTPSEEKPAESEKNKSAPSEEKPAESEKNESAPGEEKPAESEKKESQADLTIDFSDVEKILSITSSSLANIKSKGSSNMELCQKLSELSPIVNIPPIKSCSDKDVIEYLLHVLNNIAMRKCIE